MMKAFARVVALFVMFLSADAAWAQSSQDIARGIQKIKELVINHPEPLVRQQLFAWITDGRVKFAANNISHEMSTSLGLGSNREQVLLWYNVNFVLRGIPQVAERDREDYFNLVLYHETVKINEHFNGRTRLIPAQPIGPVSEYGVAQQMWDLQWIAKKKEWEFAKKIGKPHLVPVIAIATKNGETPLAFLEGFYYILMRSPAPLRNPALAAGITARYQQELTKLRTR